MVRGEGLAAREASVAGCSIPSELIHQAQAEHPAAPVTAERIGNAFGGRLKKFIDVRTDVASSLYEETAKIVKSGKADVRSALYTDANVPVTGLSPTRVDPYNNRPTVQPGPDNVRKMSKLTRWKPYLAMDPSHYKSKAEFTKMLSECIDVGIDGFHIYNYGLLRKEELEWVGSSEHLWADK